MESSVQPVRGEETRERVIVPPRGWQKLNLRELWEQRDLILLLMRRDLGTRYKQTTIGIFWTIAQPLALTVIFSVFFGVLAKVPSSAGIPYPLFAASGMILWLAISEGFGRVSMSTMTATALLSKIYFPRLAVPIASLAAPMLDFLAGVVIVLLLGIGYGFDPSLKLLAFPLLIVGVVGTALGAGLWFAALSARYRDVILLLPLVSLIGLFISPIIYPIDLVPQELQEIYVLNPVAGLMEFYRWMLLPLELPVQLLAISTTVSVTLLVSGAYYYKRAEPGFADVI